jgi:hemerythrin superfamily protein
MAILDTSGSGMPHGYPRHQRVFGADTGKYEGGGMAEGENLISVLVTDHREVEEMFTELETEGLSPQRRAELRDKVIAELVRHSVAEEMYLYPATRTALPGGDQLADREIEEHAAAERLMKDLEKVDPQDVKFDDLLTQLITDVRGHIGEEETDLFPRLQAACSEQELVDLGAKVQLAKKVAPTRPHPSAPDTPPLNKVMGPPMGIVDRIRDALSGREH